MTKDVLEQLRAPYGYFGRALRKAAADEIQNLRDQITLQQERDRLLSDIRAKLYKRKKNAKCKSKSNAG